MVSVRFETLLVETGIVQPKAPTKEGSVAKLLHYRPRRVAQTEADIFGRSLGIQHFPVDNGDRDLVEYGLWALSMDSLVAATGLDFRELTEWLHQESPFGVRRFW